MIINIKNMVCNRCISAVQKVFENQKIEVLSVELGEIHTVNNITEDKLDNLEIDLNELGFQILQNAAKNQIEQVKKFIILKINELDIAEDFILSTFIAEKLNRDYSVLSKNFSLNENVTLEHYFILQKIEKVKELLLYNELTLTEISQKIGYKSVQHLSAQFKTTSGFTPTSYKSLQCKNRISVDLV